MGRERSPIFLPIPSGLADMDPSPEKIYILPIGHVGREILEAIAKEVEVRFLRSAVARQALPYPGYAHRKARRQYLAGAFLSRLRTLELPAAHKILGVVDLDLYAPGLNFVFGQASSGGREAIITLPRLRQEFYGPDEDEFLFQKRMLKEAIHELGHTYGLSHCPHPRCVMYFSNSLKDTDLKGRSFCPRCQRVLTESGWG